MRILEKIKNSFIPFRDKRVKKIMKECGCVCYCPKCREPLNDGICESTEEYGLYQYTCKCGEKSMFHFGIAPVPIFIEAKKEI